VKPGVAVFLRSAWALLVAVLATVLVTGTGILAALAVGPTAPAIHGFYQVFARLVLWGFGARVRVAGLEGLEPGARYVIVSNHQSHLDPLALVVAFRAHPLRFVAKQELARVPIFGQALRASGTVFVTRSDTRTDVGRIERAQAALLEAVSVLFFAEGTRSHTGELGPFKKGAAVFGLKNGLPLLPVGVSGSFEILPRGFRALRRGTIGVSVGRPIPTKGRDVEERDALTAELRAAVVAEIERARQLVG
jgi:1-acyl-sn-glycerol-3-phosphate acyltransferase